MSMRGYVQKQSDNGLRFIVKYHSICEVSRKEKEGFEEIKVQDVSSGEEITKYVRRYDALEALVTKIEFRDTKQQYDTRFMSWLIHLTNAEGKPAVLEIPFKTNASDRFMKLAENINFTKPVEFRVWCDTSGKKDKTAFYVGQRVDAADEKSISVPQKYRRGEMGDCPEPVEELDGWNYSAQLKYLHSQMLNVVVPRVEAANAMRNAEPEPEFEQESESEESNPFADDDDDIPF